MRSRGLNLVHLQTSPRLLAPKTETKPDVPRPLLLPRYPGLPDAFTQKMHECVRSHEHHRFNRLKKNLEGAFAAVYQAAGVDEVWARPLAEASALMETRAVTTLRQKTHYLQEEHKRRSGHRYTVQSVEEDEATKLTRWTIEQVPGSGLPLFEIERLLDQAVELGIRGAFTPRGGLRDTPGVPMVLPGWFRRRGWQVHWLDPRYLLSDVDDGLMVVRLV